MSEELNRQEMAENLYREAIKQPGVHEVMKVQSELEAAGIFRPRQSCIDMSSESAISATPYLANKN